VAGHVVAPVVGAFLIAAAVTPVMEFETDVPQFPVVWYWPALVGMLVFAFALIRRLSDRTTATTEAAAVFVLLRRAGVGFLGLLGHSSPTVMPTVAAALAFDLSARREAGRTTMAAVTAVTVVVTHTVAHAWQPAGLTFGAMDVVVGALLAVVTAWLALAAAGLGASGAGRTATSLRRASTITTAVAVMMVGLAGAATAHDPGQGDEVASVTLVAARSGDHIDLALRSDDGTCAGWDAGEVLARRAGRIHAAPLVAEPGCRFSGAVTVDAPGRWFVYAELDVDDHRTEAWIPVEHEHGPQVKATELYTPAVRSSWTPQVVAGIVLYALVLGIFAAVAVVFRRAANPRTGRAVRR
jgi:hypothetical protein